MEVSAEEKAKQKVFSEDPAVASCDAAEQRPSAFFMYSVYGGRT